jgi:hypothetical protein
MPGMRVTLDAAMRVRDVSPHTAPGDAAAAEPDRAEPAPVLPVTS